MSLRTVIPRAVRSRRVRAGTALLSGVLLLAACGGDATDPAEAETGIPLSSGDADPAASPDDSADPLTGSSP